MLVLFFLVIWAVITVVTGLLGVRGFLDSLLLALIPTTVLTIRVSLRRNSGKAVYDVPGEPPLHATYASDNMALDVPARRLWLRDVSGRTMIVELSQIAGWEHTWTDTTNGYGRRFRVRNEISLRLRQLDVPTVRVGFRRFSDNFNGNRNYDQAAEWQARLTTLING